MKLISLLETLNPFIKVYIDYIDNDGEACSIENIVYNLPYGWVEKYRNNKVGAVDLREEYLYIGIGVEKI